MVASAASSSYFQGGDYVELLSAQGKAPATTWKLQGKIIKSFDKAIKGNAFHMDGSSETKMQLPKTPTPSSSSLGLTQRFLVFQLCVAHTRSFSIEIGFSDFQKIRRRLVFASAFRETAMTALHVQIPLSSRSISRDHWMNFVFDLQALTEYYFPGSSFRSMESICISGSCRLKRIFTMKDAPMCPSVDHEVQAQMAACKLPGKDASTVPTVVAGFAEMKEIPKQFLFSVGPSCLPIPTEYFLTGTAAEREPIGTAPLVPRIASKSAAGKTGKAAVASKSGPAKPEPAEILGTNRKRAQTADKAPVTGSSSTRETRARSAESVRTNEIRPEEPSKNREAPRTRGTESSPHSARHPHQVSPAHVSSAPTRSTTRAGESNTGVRNVDIERSPHVSEYHDSDNEVAEDEENEENEEEEKEEKEGEEEEEEQEEQEEEEEVEAKIKSVAGNRYRLSTTLSPARGNPRQSQDVFRLSAAQERKNHRHAVIAEIQSKLDQLTREADDEDERDRKMVVQRVSLGSKRADDATSTSSEAPSTRAGIFTFTTDHRAASSSTNGKAHIERRWLESDLLRSPEPMVLKRLQATKKPEIMFSSSIFSFDCDAPDSNLAASNDSSSSGSQRNKRLFDWNSLLEDSVESLSKSPSASSALSRPCEPRDKVAIQPTVEDTGPPRSSFVAQILSTISLKHQPAIATGSRGTTKSGVDTNSTVDSSPPSKTPEAARSVPAAVQNKPKREDAQENKTASEVESTETSRTTFERDYLLGLIHRSRDHHDEIASATELIGQVHAQPSPRSDADDSDGDLSIDLTENLGELDPSEAEEQAPDGPETDAVPASSPASGTSEDEDSFNFDELVVRDRDYQPPPQKNEIPPKRATSRPAATSTVVAIAIDSSQKMPFISESHDSTPPTKSNGRASKAARVSSSRVPEVITKTHSPLRKNAVEDPHAKPGDPTLPVVSRVMSSSHRRLASLLESTDWSQLPLSSPVVLQEPALAPTSSSLELVYDPILRCYYDPVGKKYYTLAK